MSWEFIFPYEKLGEELHEDDERLLFVLFMGNIWVTKTFL